MRDLYRTQRAIRARREAALQRGVVAILDIGTSKIACLILRFDGDPPDAAGIGPMAGQTRFRVIGAATTRARGVRYGEIVAMQDCERAIRTAVQAAQKMANIRVDHVIACFSGARPRSYGLAGEVGIDDIVADGDIARALAACDLPETGARRETLHAQPVNFALDGRSGLSDPRGQTGRDLAVDVHLLTVDAPVLENLAHCIKRCDLELAGVASAAYAAGLSALVENEQELGAACIDMGGGSTGISVFLRKHMIYADAVRLGGEHVTRDIGRGLNLALATAERIKTFHGGVQATGLDDRERIDTGDDDDPDGRIITRAELIGVIRPRVEEILEEVRDRLDAAGFDHLPSQRIVLTGGMSQLPGLDALASRILGQQVRLGRPLRVQGLPQAAIGPGFAAAVGLSLFAAHPQDEWWDFQTPAERHPARSLRRAVRWFQDNW
ncbi:MAG: cell division protein FtsA [Rhodobacteraceae bacterium]|jgi:cell division protein FtsA|nr:cell division protein FtsA [Paracoccaceae bacterium]MBL4556566.1 cell division protein FtsA [Paracoccaceae bacterium]HBH00162.1 cell division protein FtsA [Paracoccaceae bacterium]